ncbi:MAG: family transporter [Thermoleophilia bacterium]|nr:family transporter [Thermoleophilia bacterium]
MRLRSLTHPTPLVAVVLGSGIIAWSAIFVRLADVSVTTAALYRCAYAVPPLLLLTLLRLRGGQQSRLTRRQWFWASLAGASFGADLVLWHVSIDSVGAGLATVLGNTQVLIVPLVAWIAWGERPHVRQLAALPILTGGIVLIAGVVGGASFGDAPLLGAVTGVLTGVAYAGFLLCLRAGRVGGESPVAALAIATTVAAIVSGLAGLVSGDLEPIPSWPAHGWLILLALSCQVLAWLLIATSLVRIRAAQVSITLLIQPVTALFLGVLVLAEDPSAWQWTGAAIALVGILIGARTAPSPAERSS